MEGMCADHTLLFKINLILSHSTSASMNFSASPRIIEFHTKQSLTIKSTPQSDDKIFLFRSLKQCSEDKRRLIFLSRRGSILFLYGHFIKTLKEKDFEGQLLLR